MSDFFVLRLSIEVFIKTFLNNLKMLLIYCITCVTIVKDYALEVEK